MFSYAGYLYLLLQFCHCDNSTWHLAAVATSIPHCQIPETTNSYTCVYLQPLFLGLPGFLNLGPKLDESTLNCGDYWMQAFRVKIYAVACACFSVHSGIQRNLVHCQQKSKLKSRNPLWNPEIQSKNDTGYHQKILYFKLITSLDLHGRARRHNSTYISAHKWSLYPTNFRYKGHFPRWRCNVMHAYLFMHYIYTPYVVSRPRPKIGRGLGWG